MVDMLGDDIISNIDILYAGLHDLEYRLGRLTYDLARDIQNIYDTLVKHGNPDHAQYSSFLTTKSSVENENNVNMSQMEVIGEGRLKQE